MENFPHTSYNVKRAVANGDYDAAKTYAVEPFWQHETLMQAIEKATYDGHKYKDLRGKKISFEVYDDGSIYVKVYDEGEWE